MIELSKNWTRVIAGAAVTVIIVYSAIVLRHMLRASNPPALAEWGAYIKDVALAIIGCGILNGAKSVASTLAERKRASGKETQGTEGAKG